MTQPVAQTAIEVPITPEALFLRISDEAGLELEDIKRLRTTAKLGPWQANAPFPGMEQVYVIFCLFVGGQGERSTEGAHVPGEVRIYCLPRARFYPKAAGDASPPDEVPFVCYTILGAQNGLDRAVIRTDTMELGTFVEEIAHEFKQIAILADVIDDGEPCPNEACDATIDDEALFCSQCGTKLPEEAPVPAQPALS